MLEIAIIGAGPMGVYSLKRLMTSTRPLHITVFEASRSPGTGMPYSRAMNTDDMLCNAFSREIPPVTRSFLDWLKNQPASRLAEWNIAPDDVQSRAFYPRTLLGGYLADELSALAEAASQQGHRVDVLDGHHVDDVMPVTDGMSIAGQTDHGAFDCVVSDVILATGHVWPDAPRLDGLELQSPWPAHRLATVAPGRIGVIGSSLSAIDVALAIASTQGTFEPAGARMRWFPKGGAETISIKLLSLKGVMPEADFHYAYPYEPFAIFTEDALEAEVAGGARGLLDRTFGLLVNELQHADPAFFDGADETARMVDGFAEYYFRKRQEIGGLRAVAESFDAALKSFGNRETIPHRYVLLRGHELFDLILRHLSERDFARFMDNLMPVFSDAYAAVPHRSVDHLLALYTAGVLELWATGETARYRQNDDGTIDVHLGEEVLVLDTLIDARGQRSAPVTDLPFPSLVDALEATGPIVEPFTLSVAGADRPRVICLSMPQLLQRYPFSQGLANCAELSRLAVDDLLSRLDGPRPSSCSDTCPDAPTREITA